MVSRGLPPSGLPTRLRGRASWRRYRSGPRCGPSLCRPGGHAQPRNGGVVVGSDGSGATNRRREHAARMSLADGPRPSPSSGPWAPEARACMEPWPPGHDRRADPARLRLGQLISPHPIRARERGLPKAAGRRGGAGGCGSRPARQRRPGPSARQTSAGAGLHAVGVRAADARAMRVGRAAHPGSERAGVRYDSRRALARAAGGRRGRWRGQPRHSRPDRPRP
jgi:hypothetical protein